MRPPCRSRRCDKIEASILSEGSELARVVTMSSGKISNGTMIFGLAANLLFAFPAHSENLNGAWANDLSVCSKIFIKKHNRISFSENADFYGSGFIINGRELIGKLGKCHVTSQKIHGTKIEMSAECATDIAFSSDKFGLRIDGHDQITRFFPSMPGMDMKYYRCPR
jgi:hypothetical protein